MSKPKIVQLIQNSLSEEELNLLNRINKIHEVELRQFELKCFFTNQTIFDKVKSIIDPSWLSYEIFINGKSYEF